MFDLVSYDLYMLVSIFMFAVFY